VQGEELLSLIVSQPHADATVVTRYGAGRPGMEGLPASAAQEHWHFPYLPREQHQA
jgi:hypothetical protein